MNLPQLIQRKKLDKAFVRAFRQDALTEQKGECIYCYDRLTQLTVTADHVKAKSKNGSNHRSNIVAACYRCNSTKSSISDARFLKMIKHPEPHHPLSIYKIWSRRKLNLAIKRAERNILRSVGKKMEP